MRRREFLHTSALAAAAAIGGSTVAGAEGVAPGSRTGEDSGGRSGEASGKPDERLKPFELDEARIGDLQDAMISGRLTARSIAEKYLERIHEIDKSGPGVNSVIEIN